MADIQYTWLVRFETTIAGEVKLKLGRTHVTVTIDLRSCTAFALSLLFDISILTLRAVTQLEHILKAYKTVLWRLQSSWRRFRPVGR